MSYMLRFIKIIYIQTEQNVSGETTKKFNLKFCFIFNFNSYIYIYYLARYTSVLDFLS